MKPRQLTIILSICLVVVVGLAGTAYWFALGYISRSTSQLQTQLTQAAQAEANESSLAQSEVVYNRTIVPILPLITAALPTTKEPTAILAQLQNLATTNGLILSGITLPNSVGLPSATSQTVAAGSALALPISFQVTGSYAQLQSFLEQLENLNRTTTVTGLTVTRPSQDEALTYAITLNAYEKP